MGRAIGMRTTMQMHRLYNGLNAEDRNVYFAWRRKIVAFWCFIAVMVCTVLALDASVTPEQRVAAFQQSGMFP